MNVFFSTLLLVHFCLPVDGSPSTLYNTFRLYNSVPKMDHLYCPAFFVPFDNSCYRFFGTALRWDDAEAHCRKFFSPAGTQGHLVSIHSDAENGFAFELWRTSKVVPSAIPRSSPNRFDSVWIGLSDSEVDSAYRWTDGSQVRYTQWSTNQPSDLHRNNDCAHMKDTGGSTASGDWSDIHCHHDGGLPFICKLEMTSSSYSDLD